MRDIESHELPPFISVQLVVLCCSLSCITVLGKILYSSKYFVCDTNFFQKGLATANTAVHVLLAYIRSILGRASVYGFQFAFLVET